MKLFQKDWWQLQRNRVVLWWREWRDKTPPMTPEEYQRWKDWPLTSNKIKMFERGIITEKECCKACRNEEEFWQEL